MINNHLTRSNRTLSTRTGKIIITKRILVNLLTSTTLFITNSSDNTIISTSVFTNINLIQNTISILIQRRINSNRVSLSGGSTLRIRRNHTYNILTSRLISVIKFYRTLQVITSNTIRLIRNTTTKINLDKNSRIINSNFKPQLLTNTARIRNGQTNLRTNIINNRNSNPIRLRKVDITIMRIQNLRTK